MADPGTNTDATKPPDLTDAQWLATLHATGRNPDYKPPAFDADVNALHPVAPVAPKLVPMGAAPDVNAPAPTGIPMIAPAAPAPAIAKPTPAQSIAAGIEQHGGTAKQEGQRQFAEMRPEVTAAAGTPEFFQQKASQIEFDKAHPWGGDISAQPGKLGKFGHIASEIGQIGANLVAPGITAGIPGSHLNMNLREGNDLRAMGPAAQTQSVMTGNEEIPHINLATGEQETVTRKSLPMIEAAELKGQSAKDVAETKVGATDRKTEEAREAALRQHQLMTDPQNPTGAPIPIPDAQLSPQELQSRDLLSATTDLHKAQAEVESAKNDPNSPQFQLAMQHLQIAKGNLAEKYASLGVQEKKIAAEGERTDKGALKTFNADYVKPANAVEKSYEMMDNAYNEYQAARAQGKELPTGAQSMVALSTHLSTTFGNVKGARITKDMIEHHLGARGVSDSALVAIQRLTNGDVLSPAQWEAFHGLIKQSRDISWHQAAREADRAGLPLDFLPEDLQGAYGEGVATTPHAKGSNQVPTAASGAAKPPGW